MANNIGTISTILPRTIGETVIIKNGEDVNAVSGFVDEGFIGFDSNGTMAICTLFARDDQDNPEYTFRICSINTEIDIHQILSESY